MTVKELIQVLENCEEDANVLFGCSIGPGSSMKLEAFDIYERKDNGNIIFDFGSYLYENDLEDKFYNNKSDLEKLKEIKEFLESDWI